MPDASFSVTIRGLSCELVGQASLRQRDPFVKVSAG